MIVDWKSMMLNTTIQQPISSIQGPASSIEITSCRGSKHFGLSINNQQSSIDNPKGYPVTSHA
ncbi:MAG: hypothetical protein H8D67_03835 [Deltaproteobacteria bacterium]|nr:hypothetical protein [Deltaproteobacteria bacterium]